MGRKINDRLANFLDVFAFESNIVGWESFERWVFESFWTLLPATPCRSHLASTSATMAGDSTVIIIFPWKLLPNPKNNSHTFFCWGYSRKKQPGKQNNIQPFWGQGINHHQRIQLGSHRFRFTSQILTPMCLACLSTADGCDESVMFTDDGYHDICKGQPSWIWCGVQYVMYLI